MPALTKPTVPITLPVDFWPQLIARLFGQSTPKFYQIIRDNSILFAGVAMVLPWFTSEFLPNLGINVPQWLTYSSTMFVAGCWYLAGIGTGGAGVAQSTIQTPSTPPLASEIKKITVEELAAELAQLKAERAAEKERLTPS